MKRLKAAIVAVAATTFLSGCATGFKATHDHDPANDFTGYKTFAWISEHPMTVGATDRIPSPMLESRIMVTVESALGHPVEWDEAAEAMIIGFGKALDLSLRHGELEAEEQAWSTQLEEKYVDDAWTWRL